MFSSDFSDSLFIYQLNFRSLILFDKVEVSPEKMAHSIHVCIATLRFFIGKLFANAVDKGLSKELTCHCEDTTSERRSICLTKIITGHRGESGYSEPAEGEGKDGTVSVALATG